MITFLEMVEGCLNKIIRLDMSAPKYLARLNHRCCRIEIQDRIIVDVQFLDHNIRLSPAILDNIDVFIRGPFSAFLIFVLSQEVRTAAKAGLTIEGDMEVAHTLQSLLVTLNIDWEELLSRVTGDVVAQQTAQCVNKAKRAYHHISSSLIEATRLYITEEASLLPTTAEFVHFANEVDRLSADSDRLTVSIDYLEQRYQMLSRLPVEQPK